MELHRPFHLYIGRIYFITGRVLDNCGVWMDNDKKLIFRNVLSRASKDLSVKIFGWVVLNNHYHLLCDFGPGLEMRSELAFATPIDRRGELLARFVRTINSSSSRWFNEKDKTPGRKIWYQYWDYCIRNKPDFWKHFNYIVQNPLKHKLAPTLREAYAYPYSSNPIWLERFTEAGMSESFEKFPVKDWTPTDGEE